MRSIRVRTIINKSLPVFLSVLLLSSVAYASAGVGGGEGDDSIMPLVWQLLNFTILVVVLGVAIKMFNVRGMLNKRIEGIQSIIAEATEAREAAEAALKEVREKLNLKDDEIKKVTEAALASGRLEREAAEAEGQRLSEKILEQARANIQMELQNARAEIRAEAVNLAMKLAEEKLGRVLDAEQQRALMQDAIKKLEAAK